MLYEEHYYILTFPESAVLHFYETHGLYVFSLSFSRDESSNVAIIREVYDSENAHETFEYELERALESECSLIVIEPSKLGDETSRWIAVGNCLHKTAALSGLAAIVTG